MKSSKDTNLYIDKITKSKLSKMAKWHNMSMVALVRKLIKESK